MAESTLQLSAGAARYVLEVSIAAPREHVWHVLTERPDDWWVADMRCVPGDSKLTLEPRAGGSLVEESHSGGSLLWYTVLAVEPGSSINLAGALAPPYGGPCQTFLWIELDEQDGRTIVRTTHSLHGHSSESTLEEMESGWRLLLEQGLKATAEASAPGR